jgi:hypothetical protein
MLRITPSIIVVALALCVASSVESAGIDKVTIMPPIPRDVDPITVEVSGVMSSGPVTFLGSEFSRTGSDLRLDVFLDIGMLDVMTPWSHADSIGTLNAGDYDLTAWAIFNKAIRGVGQVHFTVVPEPSISALLTVVGLSLLRRRHHTRTAGSP